MLMLYSVVIPAGVMSYHVMSRHVTSCLQGVCSDECVLNAHVSPCSSPPPSPATAMEDAPTAVLRQCLRSLAPANRLDLSVETMLAKPIQRVLQYPLYLHVVTKQMGADSQERRHLEGEGRRGEGRGGEGRGGEGERRGGRGRRGGMRGGEDGQVT